MLTREELINKYFTFFKNKGHVVIPSSSIFPENDPTVLFTTAGMHPLVPYLLGEPHHSGKRLCDVQKCIRTTDIDSVGDDTHLTFFEMLGNWSLGDYFKEDSLKWSYDFLTNENYLNINKENLSFTCFEGNEIINKDNESYKTLRSLGIEENKIYFLGKKDNFWELGTGSGPCGPDCEIFYTKKINKCKINCNPSCNCGKFLEIWNNVFMEYNLEKEKYTPLENKNVDTGMGVERVITVLSNSKSVYDTSIFLNLKNSLETLSNKLYEENQKEFRVIMDHIRTSVFILGDDLLLKPSNTGRGYILRRIIRRMVRFSKKLELTEENIIYLANVVINDYKSYYNELERNKEFIISELNKEMIKFNKTLKDGLKMFNKNIKYLKENKIDGALAFKLFDTYGFPIEMTIEMAQENNLSVDFDGFTEKFKEHQIKSRTASVGEFKGGLADNSYETIKYHTAAHIMLSVLRKMYGESVIQKGSNINSDRLRFDFSLDRKMTEEEKVYLNKRVNEIINMNIDIVKEEMSLSEAKAAGALGIFDSKYGNLVSVYTIGDISKEICMGPHVKNTKELGEFKIIKEESSSSGVRRIKVKLI